MESSVSRSYLSITTRRRRQKRGSERASRSVGHPVANQQRGNNPDPERLMPPPSERAPQDLWSVMRAGRRRGRREGGAQPLRAPSLHAESERAEQPASQMALTLSRFFPRAAATAAPPPPLARGECRPFWANMFVHKWVGGFLYRRSSMVEYS